MPARRWKVIYLRRRSRNTPPSWMTILDRTCSTLPRRKPAIPEACYTPPTLTKSVRRAQLEFPAAGRSRVPHSDALRLCKETIGGTTSVRPGHAAWLRDGGAVGAETLGPAFVPVVAIFTNAPQDARTAITAREATNARRRPTNRASSHARLRDVPKQCQLATHTKSRAV